MMMGENQQKRSSRYDVLAACVPDMQLVVVLRAGDLTKDEALSAVQSGAAAGEPNI